MKIQRNMFSLILSAFGMGGASVAKEAEKFKQASKKPKVIGWRSSVSGFFRRRRSTSFTGQSAERMAKLGLRSAMDKHAAALNYRGWCNLPESGSARKV